MFQKSSCNFSFHIFLYQLIIINKLEKGDIITYQTKFYTRNYKVDNIQAIFETDWKLLENTNDNKITLITCIANKKNQRLCVQATEITANDL